MSDYGYSAFEFILSSMTMGGPYAAENADCIRATVAWLRASCEADAFPDWLTEAVMQRAQAAILAGQFPLIKTPTLVPPIAPRDLR